MALLGTRRGVRPLRPPFGDCDHSLSCDVAAFGLDSPTLTLPLSLPPRGGCGAPDG